MNKSSDFSWQIDYFIPRYLWQLLMNVYMLMNMFSPLSYLTKTIQIYFVGLPITAKQKNFICQDSL